MALSSTVAGLLTIDSNNDTNNDRDTLVCASTLPEAQAENIGQQLENDFVLDENYDEDEQSADGDHTHDLNMNDDSITEGNNTIAHRMYSQLGLPDVGHVLGTASHRQIESVPGRLPNSTSRGNRMGNHDRRFPFQHNRWQYNRFFDDHNNDNFGDIFGHIQRAQPRLSLNLNLGRGHLLGTGSQTHSDDYDQISTSDVPSSFNADDDYHRDSSRDNTERTSEITDSFLEDDGHHLLLNNQQDQQLDREHNMHARRRHADARMCRLAALQSNEYRGSPSLPALQASAVQTSTDMFLSTHNNLLSQLSPEKVGHGSQQSPCYIVPSLQKLCIRQAAIRLYATEKPLLSLSGMTQHLALQVLYEAERRGTINGNSIKAFRSCTIESISFQGSRFVTDSVLRVLGTQFSCLAGISKFK